MHCLSLTIQGFKIRLNKKPWQPVIVAKIDKDVYEFNIDNDEVTLICGEVEDKLLEELKGKIAQYFLPIQTSRKKQK